MPDHANGVYGTVLGTSSKRGLGKGPSIPALMLCCCLLVCAPDVVYADSIASSSISFSNLQIIPSVGTVVFQDAWSSEAFAQAQNSLGELDSEFASNTGASSTIAALVTFASASGTASVSPPSGAASSGATIPGNANVQAISTGTGTLFNFFEITGGTGSANVTFSTDIGGTLNVMTDQTGLLALTETIFALQLNGQPILFFDSPLSVGSNSSASMEFGQTLSTVLSLDFNTPYFLLAQADSESQAINTPEPSTLALLVTALGGLAACLRKKRTQTA